MLKYSLLLAVLPQKLLDPTEIQIYLHMDRPIFRGSPILIRMIKVAFTFLVYMYYLQLFFEKFDTDIINRPITF